MQNRRCSCPRGKVLGGSSVLNYMLYVRGHRNNYDHWAELGNRGWSYESVLPYFIKSEDNQSPAFARSPYHGTGGYLTVEQCPYRTPLAAALVEAGAGMGYAEQDLNGRNGTGFMIPQATIRHGSRCSTAKVFLWPARLRPNYYLFQSLHMVLNGKTFTSNEEVKNHFGQFFASTEPTICDRGIMLLPERWQKAFKPEWTLYNSI